MKNDEGASISKDGITNIYTWGDTAVMRMIIMGELDPNDWMIKHYDFNGDGQVTSADYVTLVNRLRALG